MNVYVLFLKVCAPMEFVEIKLAHLIVNARWDFIYPVMENSVQITMNANRPGCVPMVFVQIWMARSNVVAMKVRSYIFDRECNVRS